MEKTIAIIKPEGIERGLIGEVIKKIEKIPLQIIALEMICLPRDKAEEIFSVHKNEIWFESFLNFVSSKPIVVMVLEGENAVKKWLELAGDPDPFQALPGTIRHDFGRSNQDNVVYVPDNSEIAVFEISSFFPKIDVRRVYYDHEIAYQRLKRDGKVSWNPDPKDAFGSFEKFLGSSFFQNTGSVLDLGCGGGQLAIRLAKIGWKATGFDYSETAIKMSKENAVKADVSIDFRVTDIIKALPLQNGSFSLVIDNHVLHCLVEKEHRMTFLNNAFKALRPSGIMFSENMSAEGDFNLAKYKTKIDPLTRIDINRTRFWAKREELETEFRNAGFIIAHIELVRYSEDENYDVVIYALRP